MNALEVLTLVFLVSSVTFVAGLGTRELVEWIAAREAREHPANVVPISRRWGR